MDRKEKICRLKDEADISRVVEYLGIPIKKRGSAYFIPCPHPDHTDAHATNCYYKDGWNNVYCTACNQSINAIDLLIYTNHCEFSEAANILWEMAGRPEWYKEQPLKQKKATFYLTNDEAKLIGLKMPGRMYMAENYSDTKPEIDKGSFVNDTLDGYVVSRIEYHHWKDFMTEKEFAQMVQNKAYERFQTLYKSLEPLRAEYYANQYLGKKDMYLENVIKNRIKNVLSCQEIYLKAQNYVKRAS